MIPHRRSAVLFAALAACSSAPPPPADSTLVRNDTGTPLIEEEAPTLLGGVIASYTPGSSRRMSNIERNAIEFSYSNGLTDRALRCFCALPELPPSARFNAEFEVSAEGKVMRTRLVQLERQLPAFTSCFEASARGYALPAFGEPYFVRAPLRFTADARCEGKRVPTSGAANTAPAPTPIDPNRPDLDTFETAPPPSAAYLHGKILQRLADPDDNLTLLHLEFEEELGDWAYAGAPGRVIDAAGDRLLPRATFHLVKRLGGRRAVGKMSRLGSLVPLDGSARVVVDVGCRENPRRGRGCAP